MKKFFGFLKRVVKGPVNSLEDVKQRRKDLLILLIPCLVILLACSILGSTVDALDFLSIFTAIFVFPVMFLLFLFWMLHRIKQRFLYFTCDKCDTLNKFTTYDEFDRCVTYELVDVDPAIAKPFILDGKSPNTYKEITVRGYIKVLLKVSYKCLNCGAPKAAIFSLIPFRCETSLYNVTVRNASEVNTIVGNLTEKIKSVLTEKLDENSDNIPVTVTSVFHPNYANRTKLNAQGATVKYGDVTITYHRYVDEVVEGYFVNNEINLKLEKKCK